MTKWIDKGSPSYIFSADVVRTLAIIGVVIIHTANSVFERPDFFGGISWWYAAILNAISRICIPLFIMLSGFFLLKKERNFKRTFTRTVSRIIFPLVFWTAVILLTGNSLGITQLFNVSFVLRFFNGNVYYFYFLVILAGLYLVSPLIRSFLKQNSLKAQIYAGYLFLAAGILETASEYFVKSCASENSFTKWVPYVGLFILGYLIGTKKLTFSKNKVLFPVYFAGLAVTLALDYLYYSQGSINILRTNPTDCLTHYSDYYLSINVVLMTIPAFALLINTNFANIIGGFWQKFIYSISRASFGIYLTHLFIVTYWDKWLGWDVDHALIPLWAYITVKLIGVFSVSYVLTLLIQKIPLVRKTIGED